MLLSHHHGSFVHVTDVLISAAVLASAGGCHRSPPDAPQLEWESLELAQQHQSTMNVARLRSPGVDIVPMGKSAFVVRISSGMVGRGEPLYVIDGAPMMISPARGIDWLKPDDILQIKVLKTPDELALYGPQGVNGVIVITTKALRGRRP